MAIFINGSFRECNPEKTIFNQTIFHGIIGQQTQNNHKENCDGEMVDEQGVVSLITHWNWNQEDRTLKFLAAPTDEPHNPTFYSLEETRPLMFEGVWEMGGTVEKVRVMLTPTHHTFFTY